MEPVDPLCETRRDRSVTVTRRVSALGTAETATRRLHPALAGLATSVSGYDQAVAPGAVHVGLPSPSVPLVLSFGLDQTIQPDGAHPTTVAAFAAGVHERLVRITAPRYHGVQLDLTPVGAVRLLGRPLADLHDRCVPLADVDPELGRLAERVAAAPDWPARFDLVEAALLRRLADGPDHVRPELAWAFGALVRSGGRAPVAGLAARLGWSRRHLTGRFTRIFGVPPKRMARLVRFERAAALVAARGVDLATLAADTGYSDQAHLAREVRALSGLTPTALRGHHHDDDGWWQPR